jgi:hypothetical protein
LAITYMNKAAALGDLRAAVEFYDRALEIYERLVMQEGRGGTSWRFSLGSGL